LLSYLFAADALLQSIADDQDRISRDQHPNDPAVTKVQIGLLLWDPDALPVHGPDGDYGDETAGAVARFKRDELGVPPEQIIDDVGPRTVVRLDEIASGAESGLDIGTLLVCAPGLSFEEQLSVLGAVEQGGGQILLGLGELAKVVSGGPGLAAELAPLVGGLLAGVVHPDSPVMPPALDDDTALLVAGWLARLDPGYLLAQSNPNRFGATFSPLGGCGQGLVV
jgi:hypothetical protein